MTIVLHAARDQTTLKLNYSLSVTQIVDSFAENTATQLPLLSQDIINGQIVWMFGAVHQRVKSIVHRCL